MGLVGAVDGALASVRSLLLHAIITWKAGKMSSPLRFTFALALFLPPSPTPTPHTVPIPGWNLILFPLQGRTL